jgi:hypothetical protein
MRSSKGLESSQQLFSIIYVCVLFVSGFCCLVFFKSEYPDFGNSKGLHQSIGSTRSITKEIGVILCKDF